MRRTHTRALVTACAGLLCLVLAGPAAAQGVEGQGQVVFGLVPLESDCDKPLECAIEVLQRGDSSVLVAHPGDRFQIAFANRSPRPVYAGLLILSGAMALGQMAGPHPLWPGEVRVLPDTIVIDDRLGTDLLMVLSAARYFSVDDFPTILAEDFHGESGWRLGDLEELIGKNEVGIRITNVYYHVTTRRRS